MHLRCVSPWPARDPALRSAAVPDGDMHLRCVSPWQPPFAAAPLRDETQSCARPPFQTGTCTSGACPRGASRSWWLRSGMRPSPALDRRSGRGHAPPVRVPVAPAVRGGSAPGRDPALRSTAVRDGDMHLRCVSPWRQPFVVAPLRTGSLPYAPPPVPASGAPKDSAPGRDPALRSTVSGAPRWGRRSFHKWSFCLALRRQPGSSSRCSAASVPPRPRPPLRGSSRSGRKFESSLVRKSDRGT